MTVSCLYGTLLSCDKNSNGNALEMANLFYESGYFDSAEPDLMDDFLMGCTNDPLFAEQWHLNNTGQAEALLVMTLGLARHGI